MHLHEALYYLVKVNNENLLMEAQTNEENALLENGIINCVSGSYKNVSECCYFYGQYSKNGFGLETNVKFIFIII
jgi:hypothetical protein